MNISLLYSGIDFVVNPEFQAFHIRSSVMDSLFILLVVLFVFYLLAVSPYCMTLLKYPLKVDSYMSGNRTNIKYGIVLFSKILILLSVPVTIAALYPSAMVSDNIVILCVISTFSIMVLRYVAFSLFDIFSVRSSFFATVRYATDCLIVIFALFYVFFLVLSYSLSLFPVVLFIFVPVFCIMHIIRMIKLFKMASFSFFDIFLYLCAFDLLPLIIAICSIYKILG